MEYGSLSQTYNVPIRMTLRAHTMMDDEAQAHEQISRLVLLPTNWDSHGSQPVQEAAVDGAHYLLRQSCRRGLPLPQILPAPGGGLQLEWNLVRRALELEIGPEGKIGYLFVDDDQRQEREGTIPSYRDPAALEAMNWLQRGNVSTLRS